MSILSNHPYSYFIFSDVSWLLDAHFGGCGFYIIDSYNRIVLACCSNIVEYSALDAELVAAEIGLKIANERKFNIDVLFTNSCNVKQVFNQSRILDDQRMN